MLVPHVHLKGKSREAIKLYVKAFGATVAMLLPAPGQEDLISHAEIVIHGQRLMINDFGGFEGGAKSDGYQLVVIFDDEECLKAAYSALEEGSTTVYPMGTTDYSACVVRFVDRFGVRWAFMV